MAMQRYTENECINERHPLVNGNNLTNTVQ